MKLLIGLFCLFALGFIVFKFIKSAKIESLSDKLNKEMNDYLDELK